MSERKQKEPRKPGRPQGGEDLRDIILDKAELAFAADGYEGASLRDIAVGAGVNQALIRYYFGSKQELFDDVFRRRGRVLSARRVDLLNTLLSDNPQATVNDIIRAYLLPQWEMKRAGGNFAAFLRLQAWVNASQDEHDKQLRREVYDAPVVLYVDALQDRLPNLPRSLIALRMGFLIGSYLFVLNDLARLDDLLGSESPNATDEDVLTQLITYLSAGMVAPQP